MMTITDPSITATVRRPIWSASAPAPIALIGKKPNIVKVSPMTRPRISSGSLTNR